MAPDDDATKKTLTAQALEFLSKDPISDENIRRNCIWRFAEKLNVSPVAKARFVNEVHARWQHRPPEVRH
jgi:hypothetical protein